MLGSDKFGGVFEGRIIEGGLGGADRVVLKLRVPPGGCLVTGLCVGDEGAVVDVRGTLKRQGFCWGGTFEVAQERVDVSFHFVGPLPQRFAP